MRTGVHYFINRRWSPEGVIRGDSGDISVAVRRLSGAASGHPHETPSRPGARHVPLLPREGPLATMFNSPW